LKRAKLRIATYNLLAGGSARRANHWEMLREHIAPDILLTQESKSPDAHQFPHRTSIWREALKGRWGTALIATSLDVTPLHVRGFRGWISGGEIDLGGRPLRIFSVHIPAGDHGYVRTVHRMIDRLKPHARAADLILGGDFNVAVGFRTDGDPVKMSRAERTVLTRLVDELDLFPCWQAHHGAKPLAQTLRWTGNRAAPYHCDGIFAPRAWRERLRSCEVVSGPEWDRLSDHNPVIAEFQL
jgi:endonuclease/exonuclease/phosphatase family metal-dependent hydrolase